MRQTATNRKFKAPIALVSLSLSLAGCGPNGSSASNSLSNASFSDNPKPKPAQLSEKSAVYLRLKDGNLISITEVQGELNFHKTSTGYAQSGGSINVAGFGVGAESIKGNVYFRISPFEALAYVDNDWTKLYEPTEREFKRNLNSVNPALIKNQLEPLVDPNSKNSSILATVCDIKLPPIPAEPMLPNTSAPGIYAIGGDEEMYRKALSQHEAYNYAVAERQKTILMRQQLERYRPVYIRIESNDLLRIAQVEDNKVAFYKNAAGYANTGLRAQIPNFSFSVETIEGNLYYQISPEEVIGYFDGNRSRIIEAVRKQQKIFGGKSVSAELVEAALP